MAVLPMKIATWNVNSLKVRLPQVLQWLKVHKPDVLVLQELKLDQNQFPLAAIEACGYHAVWNGQKTYNGVAILSKHAINDVVPDMPDFADAQKRVLAATIQGVRFVSVYCVNGEAVGSEKFAYKERWFAALRDYTQKLLAQYNRVVMLGDFNIAPSDADVYDAEKWHEKILCSTPERTWLRALLDTGLSDSLRLLDSTSPQYTWWDYRMNMFKRKLGIRIDLILISDALKPALRSVQVDTEARGWERPSDHAPVYAVFDAAQVA